MRPERYPSETYFIANVLDASPKSDIASLEHPIFALAKQPDTEVRRYERKGVFVRITPSVDGMATIWDKDVLIYCVSQVREAMNRGSEVGPTIQFHPHDLFRHTNKPINGNSYHWLRQALSRLRGMTIETNVRTGGLETFDTFGLVDKAHYERRDPADRDSKTDFVSITLSDWQFRAIEHREVLTIDRGYFRLHGALERRLYEIGRKHCGKQRRWAIGIETLHAKSGSRAALKSFRYAVRVLVRDDKLPDYALEYIADKDQLGFTNRKAGPAMLARALKLSS